MKRGGAVGIPVGVSPGAEVIAGGVRQKPVHEVRDIAVPSETKQFLSLQIEGVLDWHPLVVGSEREIADGFGESAAAAQFVDS